MVRKKHEEDFESVDELDESENTDEIDDQPIEPTIKEDESKLGDEAGVARDIKPEEPGKITRFFRAYVRKKKWTYPLTALVILGALFAVPTTRYLILGSFMTRNYQVSVVDSKTNTPINNATVVIDGKKVATNASGTATIKAHVGGQEVDVSKQYYKDFSKNVTITLRSKQSMKVQLFATGRQVPIKIMDKITGRPVANAEVSVLDTEAKTDAKGQALIVLPTDSPMQAATISAKGYTSVKTKVQVTSDVVPENTFQLVPAGRVYFLSNLSGNIDVVGTNLDGSGRQTVLAGTGNEEPNNTVLLTSSDWQYLALLSKRDGGNTAKLFLIKTATGQLSTIDSANASFGLVGWSGHHFVYKSTSNSLQIWQTGQNALKTYNADNGNSATIDQTTASGSSSADYLAQTFGGNPVVVGGSVVYTKQWGAGYTVPAGTLSSKQDQIMSANVDGTNAQSLKDVAISGQYQYVDTLVKSPGVVYFHVGNASGSTYYIYKDGSVTQTNTISDAVWQQTQQNGISYLLSPSGNATFWSEKRDGKNTLLVGGFDGSNGKQILSLSTYEAYGWYTDGFLLLDKGGGELYVMSVTGGNALKVADYYTIPHTDPAINGGYGELFPI